VPILTKNIRDCIFVAAQLLGCTHAALKTRDQSEKAVPLAVARLALRIGPADRFVGHIATVVVTPVGAQLITGATPELGPRCGGEATAGSALAIGVGLAGFARFRLGSREEPEEEDDNKKKTNKLKHDVYSLCKNYYYHNHILSTRILFLHIPA
jgi:hypothetical protein